MRATFLLFLCLDGIFVQQSTALAFAESAPGRKRSFSWENALEFLSITAPLVMLDIHSMVVRGDDPSKGEQQLIQVGEEDTSSTSQSSFHILQNLNMQQWSIRADPQIMSGSCQIVYVAMYTMGWLSLGMFIGFIQEHEMSMAFRASRAARFTIYFAWTAFAANLTYAVVVPTCSDYQSGSCSIKSRVAFNFLWPGFILVILGGLLSWSPQSEDRKLERYLMSRQTRQDGLYQLNDDYDTSSAYKAHREQMNRLTHLNKFTSDMNDYSGRVDSVVLKPVRVVPRSFGEYFGLGGGMAAIGLLWVSLIVINTATACASTNAITAP